ncbi:inositol-tetrakisphosphate 1-kinase [Phascolomyces articulosus]|uniref:inositol-1,3,4-trisphosphate 5/6-kinase n=1 Tax=Phascolomyces articulosus TaxID=60185 RepID=A0AAD5PFM5_9FUNG|nr:inositol-tetrakisphosphate 1-kinase [Phascolomyces articulosus]
MLDHLPFDLLVHKMSDVHGNMLKGNNDAKVQFERFLNFCIKNPQIRVLDPWQNVQVLLNRKATYDLCVHASETTPVRDLFQVPKAVYLNTIQDAKHQGILLFPSVCKRQKACGTGESHHMVLVQSKEALPQLESYFHPNEPVVFQEFIPHDGALVKVYVADGQLFTYVRPSFKNNFGDCAFFDSQTMPKAFDDPSLGTTEKRQPSIVNTDISIKKKLEACIDHERLQTIAHHLQKQLGVTMYGFDVLLKSGSMDAYYVVDVNYFPSFKEVKDFHIIYTNILNQHVTP